MSDPVNSSDEAVEAAVRAILAMPGTLFKDDCHADHIQSAGCPVCKGDVPAMVRAAYPVIAAAVRAEAVADVLAEQAKFVETATFHQTVGNYQYQVPGLSWSNAQAAARLAAVPVPVATPTGIVRPNGVPYTTDEVTEIFAEQQHSLSVATPEPEWHNAYDCDAGLGDIHPQFVCERPYRVATPPAEPAARVTRESIERGAAAMRDAMAAPSQPWSDPDHDVAGDMRRAMGDHRIASHNRTKETMTDE